MSGSLTGVIGASGSVGRAAVRELDRSVQEPLRLGARQPGPLRDFASRAGIRAEVRQVDVFDPGSLSRFCDGCSTVLNCAGPACHVGSLVAAAALAADADYVDASGDDELYDRIAGLDFAGAGRAALISSGMMPGLTALLPRYLAMADGALDPPLAMTAFIGGCDRFTMAAATDYMAADRAGYGHVSAGWRDGRRCTALASLTDVRIPLFPRPVTAIPYFSTESERFARAYGVRDVRWYSVFDGVALLNVLRRYQFRAGGSAQLTAAQEVCRAAELDLFGRQPYQSLVVRFDGGSTAGHHTRTLMLRAGGASELTGTVAALAVCAVKGGEGRLGTHHMGEALDPAAFLRRLRKARAAPVLHLSDAPVDARPDSLQEGAL